MELRKSRKPGEPIETTLPLGGEEYPMEIIPLTEDEISAAYKPFRKKKSVWNATTKQMETLSYLDTDDPKFREVHDNLVCRAIHNFRIIDADTKAPLDGTLDENKLALASVQIEDFEDVKTVDEEGLVTIVKVPRKRSFGATIVEKALELSKATIEAETKNS